MAEAGIVALPTPQPNSVTFDANAGVRFTPNELRALKAETGRSMTDLLGPDADDADRMQTIGWLNLRRQGTPRPWDECGDVSIEIQIEPPDPTTAAPLTS